MHQSPGRDQTEKGTSLDPRMTFYNTTQTQSVLQEFNATTNMAMAIKEEALPSKYQVSGRRDLTKSEVAPKPEVPKQSVVDSQSYEPDFEQSSSQPRLGDTTSIISGAPTKSVHSYYKRASSDDH